MKQELEEGKRQVNNYLRYSGLGFQIAGTIAAGVFIGYMLDKWAHTTQPYFTAAFGLLFVFLGLYLGLKDFFKTK